MSGNKNIACPKCGHTFDADQSLRDEYNQKYQEAVKRKEVEIDQKWQAKEQKIINEQNTLLEEKRHLELVALRLQNENAQKDKQIELEKEKYLAEKRKEIEEQERQKARLQLEQHYKSELEKVQIVANQKLREEQIKSEQVQKALEEANRKANQKSMQLQGEAQELILEDWLKQHFPYDKIEEVGKGIKGADCIQVVCNEFGRSCGKIVFESKNTKSFSSEWIEKLKSDLQKTNANIGVLVTSVLPNEIERGGFYKGVWVCQINELYLLIPPIREMIIKLNFAQSSQKDSDSKMKILYDYIMSESFKNSLQNINDTFLRQKNLISHERNQMEKIWNAREKELEKAMLSVNKVIGDVGGIAGYNIQEFLPSTPQNYLE